MGNNSLYDYNVRTVDKEWITWEICAVILHCNVENYRWKNSHSWILNYNVHRKLKIVLYCCTRQIFPQIQRQKKYWNWGKIFGAVGLGSDNVNLASLALRGVEPAIYQKVQVIYSYGIAQYDTAFSGCNWLIECYILFEDLPLTSCLRATWPPHLTSVSLPVRAAP